MHTATASPSAPPGGGRLILKPPFRIVQETDRDHGGSYFVVQDANKHHVIGGMPSIRIARVVLMDVECIFRSGRAYERAARGEAVRGG